MKKNTVLPGEKEDEDESFRGTLRPNRSYHTTKKRMNGRNFRSSRPHPADLASQSLRKIGNSAPITLPTAIRDCII